MTPEDALRDLALVFAVLFAASLVAGWLRQSIVPLYILAGVVLQPFVRDPGVIAIFALLGVAVLLFVIGLEFSFSSLRSGAWPMLEAGLWDLGINFPVGLLCGLGLGFPWLGSVAFAAAFHITSSVIVARSIIERRLAANVETPAALGVIVFEDLWIALFLAVFTGVAASGMISVAPAVLAVLKVGVFAAVFLGLARLLRRPLRQWLERTPEEPLIVFVFFWLVLAAAVAHTLGLSEAVGAFLAGVAVAETGARRRVERIVVPYQQLFAALFFVGFGLLVDLEGLLAMWPAGVVIAVIGLTSKIVTGWVVGWRQGLRPAPRLRLGFLLVPRGEFSVVVASAAVALAVPDATRISAIVAVYVLILSLLGPVLIGTADPIARKLSSFGGKRRGAGRRVP